MERADFIHLVRLSEHASADDSRAYRRSVAVFAALGYLWVIACFVLAAVILFWTVGAMTRGHFKVVYIGLVAAAAGLLWTSLRALWCRFDAPPGVVLSPADAPALFEALERIRKKIKGPPIHRVQLDANFNASITQLPRYGLFGGAVNYLTIGLPLLLAIDRPRFLAVMAHEYGHLRGNHGQFAAWIYRTRLSWTKLEHGMRHDEGPMAAVTQAFLRWYFPRFLAKTFALARQDEFEADRIAGKLLGREVAGAALTEIAIKGAWITREFWPLHWRAASSSAQPVGPYTAMRKLLALPLPGDFARETLRQTLGQFSGVDDTHPVLRDRLEALDVDKSLPAWSTQPALDLLGANGAKWLAHFDKQWCRDNASDWKQHHAYLGRVRARVDVLAASAGRNNADEMAELGDLKKRLDSSAEVRACYERALQITPGHAAGLRGLVQCLKGTEHVLRLDCLGQLFEHSVANRWWACRMAVAEMEIPATDGSLDDKALKLWRSRLRQAEEAESRAREELSGLDDENRYNLCRSLERTLDLPGPVLVLWAGDSPTLADIEHHTFGSLYNRK